MKLENQIAIVTGAGRGIGKAIAEAYAAEGAHVVCAARSVDEIDKVAKTIGGSAIPCDVSDEKSIQSLIDNVVDQHGRIDILVNNAGAVARLPVHELPVEEWDTVLNVNLRGLFLCTKYALIPMLSRKTGCIINISSGAGVSGPPNRSAYAASKHGVMGFTKVLVAEYLRKGIRSHVILPDATVSQMRSEGFPTEDPDSLIQADDIADAAVFLATQKITAHTLEVRVSQGLATRHIE
ncbi:MAG: 2-deoxy-D-gluconate 3-dehydrogenase [Gammaproteobacteria bacterium]|jgi:NAD(P)-dependent dehydrogenase (short-subunit alcohol dehydrogenase family)|nr:MAG: 2-deoxy-D-gluconate 3-dehydrogenase [Gammaproteobacteria bacterium]|tara:strand:- start:8 stop:718 length:711 start_codon:yes stop_codon:yes gene_type:complete